MSLSKYVVILMCCTFAAGCANMPISAGTESENPYLFESPQALKKIVKEDIYFRMPEEEVDRVLGIELRGSSTGSVPVRW